MSDTQLSVQQQVTPMEILQSAIASGLSPDVIRELVAMHQSAERFSWEREERQAKIDFDDALNRCQRLMTRVNADMTNPQTHSKYASYAALDRAIRPIFTEEGFSVSFGEDETSTADTVVMLGTLSRSGIQRVFRKTIVVDTKGPKGNDVMTKTHASGSAGSYAKRYLLKDMFNIAIGEDDNDGNTQLPEDITRAILAMMDAQTTDDLLAAYKEPYKAAFMSGSSHGKILRDTQAKRWKELTGEEL